MSTSEVEKLLNPGTVHLIGRGRVPAKPASEFRVGEKRMYNYGHVGTITKIVPKTPRTLEWTVEENGKEYTTTVRVNTLVPIAK